MQEKIAKKRIKRTTPPNKKRDILPTMLIGEKYQTLLHRPETITGFIALGVCAIVLVSLMFSRSLRPISVRESGVPVSTSQPSALTPVVPELLASESAALATPAASPALQVRVVKDQTFWELASRYCGSHQQAEQLAKSNGYASVSNLKEGDLVTISCVQQ